MNGRRLSHCLFIVTITVLLAACATRKPVVPDLADQSDFAIVIGIEGSVTITTPGGDDVQDVGINRVLEPGDMVTTGNPGLVTIRLFDGTTLVAAHDSSLVVSEQVTGTGGTVARYFLNVGRVFAIRKSPLPAGSDFTIDTPQGNAAIRGSAIGVSYTRTINTTVVTCFEGTCSAALGEQETAVAAGEQAAATSEGLQEPVPMTEEQLGEWQAVLEVIENTAANTLVKAVCSCEDGDLTCSNITYEDYPLCSGESSSMSLASDDLGAAGRLRGTWSIAIENPAPSLAPDYTVHIVSLAEAPGTRPGTAFVGAGCFARGEATLPVAFRAASAGSDRFDVVIAAAFETASSNPSQLSGTVSVSGDGVSGVTDAVFQSATAEASGWALSAFDPAGAECPEVVLNVGDFYFNADVYMDVNIASGQRTTGIIYGGVTNTLSAGMIVIRPDNTTEVIPLYDDVFSLGRPEWEVRLSTYEPGSLTAGDVYTFVLMDALGNPIPGAVATDFFTACTPDAPAGVSAEFLPGEGIMLAWNAVPSAPGFNPPQAIGFYQIGVNPADGPALFGANEIKSPRHLIPWTDFGSFAAGAPDGQDHGQGLASMPDGTYVVTAGSFAHAVEGSASTGLECQVMDEDETITFTKRGDSIIIGSP